MSPPHGRPKERSLARGRPRAAIAISLALTLVGATLAARAASAPGAAPAPAAAAPSHDSDPQAPATTLTLEALLARIGGKPKQSARFVEKKYLAVLDAPVESAGTLRYEAPDRLEKNTERPIRESMMLDGDQLVVERDGRRRSLPAAQLPGVAALVGILADRLLDTECSPSDRREFPFLGRPAAFPVGPFRMAALLKRPVILMLGIYLGENRYRLVFEELYDFSLMTTNRQAGVEEAMRRYVQRLEHYSRAYPFNWFNFFDVWESVPPLATRDEVQPA